MPIFVIFVFGSIVLGAGAMLAPALPTVSPRIGLAAGLGLATVIVGAMFYASIFGWNTLVIDYLWFALLVGIFLAGTLSAGMFRAEAEGGTKEYGGWPGPRELAFLLMVAIVFAAPALMLPVPMDTDAQGFGYLALALRNSGSLTTLAPFHPEITYLYSPGFPALVAYLSHQLQADLQNIQLALGAVLSVVFIWIAYDFGNEIDTNKERRTGMVFAVCALFGTGLLTADLDSHYPALLGLVFALSFLTFAIRFHREGKRGDFIAAAITLAAVPLSTPDLTIILILGYVPWLLTMWLANPRPTMRRWLGLAVGIPLLALVGIAPWLIKIAPLLGSNIQSPFTTSLHNLVLMFVYHGGVVVLLSVVGIVVALRRRNPIDLLMLPWIVLLIDFSSLGILQSLVPGVFAPITRYAYPFSIAWHGPIIPYMYFGGTAILWMADRVGYVRAENWIRTISLPAINLIALMVVLIMLFIDPLLAWSKGTSVQIFGTFASKSDVQAMEWLQRNAPPDAIILNYPGEEEGQWVPIIAQRNSIYFRPQPFFRGTEQSDAQQQALLAFWKDPDDPANKDLLAKYHIRFVIVPQIVTNPDSFRTMLRWREPLPSLSAYKPVSANAFLKLVFNADGAQVYQVLT